VFLVFDPSNWRGRKITAGLLRSSFRLDLRSRVRRFRRLQYLHGRNRGISQDRTACAKRMPATERSRGHWKTATLPPRSALDGIAAPMLRAILTPWRFAQLP